MNATKMITAKEVKKTDKYFLLKLLISKIKGMRNTIILGRTRRRQAATMPANPELKLVWERVKK